MGDCLLSHHGRRGHDLGLGLGHAPDHRRDCGLQTWPIWPPPAVSAVAARNSGGGRISSVFARFGKPGSWTIQGRMMRL